MSDAPIIKSKEISQVRQPVSIDIGQPTLWGKLSQATANIADNLHSSEMAAHAKRLAEMDTNIERQAIDLRAKHDNDPLGFDKEWETLSAQMVGNTEADLQEDLKLRLKKEGIQQYGSLMSQRISNDRQTASDSLSERADIIGNNLLSLASQGKTVSPEYQQKYKELESILMTQSNLGLRSHESVVNAMDRITNQTKEQTILYAARKAYDDGDINTVASIHEDLIYGNILEDMDPNKRRNIANIIMSDISQSQKLIDGNERRKDSEASKELKADRDRVHREYIDLSASGKMSPEWIQNNKDKMSTSLYEKAINDWGIPQGPPMSSDKFAIEDIQSVSEDDLDSAVDVAEKHYTAGRISLDDLKNVVDDVDSRKQKPVDEKERSRLRIRDSLKVPSYLKDYAKDDPAKASDAVKQLDDWISKNPNATDDDIEKRTEAIIGKYKIDALSVLPPPFGSAMPKNKVTEVTIGQGYQKLKEAYTDGKLSKAEAKQQAAGLKAWTEHLKGMSNGK